MTTTEHWQSIISHVFSSFKKNKHKNLLSPIETHRLVNELCFSGHAAAFGSLQLIPALQTIRDQSIDSFVRLLKDLRSSPDDVIEEREWEVWKNVCNEWEQIEEGLNAIGRDLRTYEKIHHRCRYGATLRDEFMERFQSRVYDQDPLFSSKILRFMSRDLTTLRCLFIINEISHTKFTPAIKRLLDDFNISELPEFQTLKTRVTKAIYMLASTKLPEFEFEKQFQASVWKYFERLGSHCFELCNDLIEYFKFIDHLITLEYKFITMLLPQMVTTSSSIAGITLSRVGFERLKELPLPMFKKFAHAALETKHHFTIAVALILQGSPFQHLSEPMYPNSNQVVEDYWASIVRNVTMETLDEIAMDDDVELLKKSFEWPGQQMVLNLIKLTNKLALFVERILRHIETATLSRSSMQLANSTDSIEKLPLSILVHNLMSEPKQFGKLKDFVRNLSSLANTTIETCFKQFQTRRPLVLPSAFANFLDGLIRDALLFIPNSMRQTQDEKSGAFYLGLCAAYLRAFRLLDDKAAVKVLFERLTTFRVFLSKRCISAAEKEIVSFLQNECGPPYVAKLEEIFDLYRLTENVFRSFHEDKFDEFVLKASFLNRNQEFILTISMIPIKSLTETPEIPHTQNYYTVSVGPSQRASRKRMREMDQKPHDSPFEEDRTLGPSQQRQINDSGTLSAATVTDSDNTNGIQKGNDSIVIDVHREMLPDSLLRIFGDFSYWYSKQFEHRHLRFSITTSVVHLGVIDPTSGREQYTAVVTGVQALLLLVSEMTGRLTLTEFSTSIGLPESVVARHVALLITHKSQPLMSEVRLKEFELTDMKECKFGVCHYTPNWGFEGTVENQIQNLRRFHGKKGDSPTVSEVESGIGDIDYGQFAEIGTLIDAAIVKFMKSAFSKGESKNEDQIWTHICRKLKTTREEFRRRLNNLVNRVYIEIDDDHNYKYLP